MSTPMPPPTPNPWVDFLLYPVSDIGSSPVKIFTSPYICILQSIKFVNMSPDPVKVFMYLLRDDGSSTEQHFYSNGVTIEPFGSFKPLDSDVLNIQPYDTLYAYSDYSSKRFNSFISYTALIQTEEPGRNVRKP